MHRCFVMTVVRPDRPGLVESIASLVTAHGGNWQESRMLRLGGQFAGMLRVDLPEEQQTLFLQSLKQLEAKGLTAVFQPDQSGASAEPVRVTAIEIVGQDRPGIVRDISRALARHGVNVEELESEVSSAAMSGEALFRARLNLSLPASCNTGDLRKDLERIAADLIVDISFCDLP